MKSAGAEVVSAMISIMDETTNRGTSAKAKKLIERAGGNVIGDPRGETRTN